MSSELAIVKAEIVDVIPRQKRTAEVVQWVEDSLLEGTPNEVLALCQQLGVTSRQIASCQMRIEAHEIKLDRHIQYVDQKFQTYDREINELKQKVAVQDAVNNERSAMQQFMIKGVMDAQNSTNQSVVKAIRGGGDGSAVFSGMLLFWGMFGFLALWAIAFAVSYFTQQDTTANKNHYRCGVHVECDVRPLQRAAPASNQFKGGV